MLGGAGVDGRPYTVRLYFSEVENTLRQARVFSVSWQATEVLDNYDIVTDAGERESLGAKGVQRGNRQRSR